MADTLKSYLVKIGFDVDNYSFNSAKDSIKSFEGFVDKTIGSMGSKFGNALTIVLGTILEVNEAMVDLIDTTANLDLETEHFARQYFVSEQQARSYTNALNQLNISESDLLYITEEEYQRLIDLNEYGKSLEAPKELDQFLVKARDIQFEFSKIGTLFEYGKRWVVYYLGKLLGGDFDKIRNKIKEFREKLEKYLPIITKKIADFFYTFYSLGKTVYNVVKDIYNAVVWFFDYLDTRALKVVGAISGALLLLKSGPLGWILFALSAILLILDDFYGWKQGKKSVFGEIFGDYEDNKDFFEGVEDFFTVLKEGVKEAFNGISLLVQYFILLLQELGILEKEKPEDYGLIEEEDGTLRQMTKQEKELYELTGDPHGGNKNSGGGGGNFGSELVPVLSLVEVHDDGSKDFYFTDVPKESLDNDSNNSPNLSYLYDPSEFFKIIFNPNSNNGIENNDNSTKVVNINVDMGNREAKQVADELENMVASTWYD